MRDPSCDFFRLSLMSSLVVSMGSACRVKAGSEHPQSQAREAHGWHRVCTHAWTYMSACRSSGRCVHGDWMQGRKELQGGTAQRRRSSCRCGWQGARVGHMGRVLAQVRPLFTCSALCRVCVALCRVVFLFKITPSLSHMPCAIHPP